MSSEQTNNSRAVGGSPSNGGLAAVMPLLGNEMQPRKNLSPWISGKLKPKIDGLYLREFDEGEAVSEFCNGQWLRDEFFPSDIQDARWRGMKAANDTA